MYTLYVHVYTMYKYDYCILLKSIVTQYNGTCTCGYTIWHD